MKHHEQITHKILSKNPKGIFIRAIIRNLYFRKDIEMLSRCFMKNCNTFAKMSYNIAKKIGILYLSFLSFRLNAENEIEVEKQSHSPPKNSY